MKRRAFLSTAGTVGVIGVASGTSVVSSAYTHFSSNVSLAEFSKPTKSILENFIANINQNTKELGIHQDLASSLAMPVRIIEKDIQEDSEIIVYKNKQGDYVTISIQDGKETIKISSTY